MTTKPKTLENHAARAKTNYSAAWPAKMWHIVREDILSQRVNDTIDGATARCEHVLDTVKNRYPNTIANVKRNVTPLLFSLNERRVAVTQAFQNRASARKNSKSKS